MIEQFSDLKTEDRPTITAKLNVYRNCDCVWTMFFEYLHIKNNFLDINILDGAKVVSVPMF